MHSILLFKGRKPFVVSCMRTKYGTVTLFLSMITHTKINRTRTLYMIVVDLEITPITGLSTHFLWPTDHHHFLPWTTHQEQHHRSNFNKGFINIGTNFAVILKRVFIQEDVALVFEVILMNNEFRPWNGCKFAQLRTPSCFLEITQRIPDTNFTKGQKYATIKIWYWC